MNLKQEIAVVDNGLVRLENITYKNAQEALVKRDECHKFLCEVNTFTAWTKRRRLQYYGIVAVTMDYIRENL